MIFFIHSAFAPIFAPRSRASSSSTVTDTAKTRWTKRIRHRHGFSISLVWASRNGAKFQSGIRVSFFFAFDPGFSWFSFPGHFWLRRLFGFFLHSWLPFFFLLGFFGFFLNSWHSWFSPPFSFRYLCWFLFRGFSNIFLGLCSLFLASHRNVHLCYHIPAICAIGFVIFLISLDDFFFYPGKDDREAYRIFRRGAGRSDNSRTDDRNVYRI